MYDRSAEVIIEFLRTSLSNGALAAADLQAMARADGLLSEHQQIRHAKAFKKAKKSLGIRSLRTGFGSQGEWVWLLPPRSIPPTMLSAVGSEPVADAQSCFGPSAADQDSLSAKLVGRRIPHQWVKGIASLEYDRPPADVPLTRWREFVTDSHKFLTEDENWAERAANLGWDELALFGCFRARPLDHLGSAGLLWAIRGGKLVDLHRDWAVIERATDKSRHVHNRRRLRGTNVTLPWIGLRQR
jgi:hypothetical protein